MLNINREGAIGILSFNRPERHNALNDELAEAFTEALDRYIADDSIRVIVLRGEGPSFCSGRDTSQLGHRAREESDYNFVLRHQQARLRQLDCPKPIIAALKGAVLGGGCEIALAADIRVSSTELKMALPEITYGLVTDTGGSQLLTALIGRARAKYMLFTGARIDAQTALAWGAVDFVVAPDQLDAKVMEIARQIASRSPLALAFAKQLVDQFDAPAIRRGFGAELIAQTAMFSSADYREARAAIREKRVPDFTGK
ncbi:MAG: enoyl-CoA hydratase/isomerase family protein [Steroidobacteraceae bacterium]